jgi:FkbM family methyltransferase
MDKNYFLNFVANNASVIESGANKGYDTVELSNVFCNGTIYAVEPINGHYKTLCENVGNLSNVKTYQLALDSTNGEAEMFVSSGNTIGSDTLLKPKEHLTLHPDIYFNEMQKVKTITFDDFVESNNITGDIVLWFDMEGNEYNVLSASKVAINQVKVIYTEYSTVERYTGLCIYEDFKKFMEELGFKEEINESMYNYLGMGNALFVRN